MKLQIIFLYSYSMPFMKNIFFIYGRGKLLLEQRVEKRFKIQDFINKAQAQCAT
jgi:hypothetical protein